MVRSDLAGLSGRGMQVCPLEQAYELAIAPRDFGDACGGAGIRVADKVSRTA